MQGALQRLVSRAVALCSSSGVSAVMWHAALHLRSLIEVINAQLATHHSELHVRRIALQLLAMMQAEVPGRCGGGAQHVKAMTDRQAQSARHTKVRQSCG